MYVDCKQISEELLGEIKNDAAHLGFNKEIAIVKSAKNSAGTVYENAIIKKAEKLNIPVRSAVLEEGVDTEKAFKTVEKLSEDKDIAGIIPMQPLDEGIDIWLLSNLSLIAAAPSSSFEMLIPAAAIGKSPTAVSTENLPPISSGTVKAV